MSHLHKLRGIALVFAFLMCITTSCMEKENQKPQLDNPFLKAWTGEYGGVPAFDKMDLSQLKSAIEKGIALNLADVDEIANNTEAPTFENTIVALEGAGQPLDRALTYYSILSSNLSSPEFRDIESEMAPKLSELGTKIAQNEKLFARIKAVYEASPRAAADEQRLIELVYDRFAMNGAELEGDARERYAAIDKELATLYTKFSNNVLADEEGYITYLTEDQLGGLPESFVKSAAQNAKENGHDGEYAIINTRSVVEPFLTNADNRALREQVWRNFKMRGDNNDSLDNKAIIAKILQLRDERVGLLGFENFASWRLKNRMAKSPENAFQLMNAIWPAAREKVNEEVADMQALADKEGANITIKPWDYLYYAEKVRKAKYDLDSDEIRQYLQLDKLREAMFYVAGELFDFSFEPIAGGAIPVFQEDVKVWQVKDKNTGKVVALWYLDPYARKGKRSGAWATTYRSHTSYQGEKIVLAANNLNFIKPAPGEPILVSWTDAETMFHEFGHALNYLCSNVKYPTLNSSIRDFVEFNSQLLEHWLPTDEVINKFLVHYKTGQPMPAALVAKIKKAAKFNQGYKTAEYLSDALVDMMYHTTDQLADIDVAAFEKNALKSIEMPEEIALRHRSTQFGHIYSGEGYAAGYYGYIWADVLVADAAEAFAEAPGGYYDKPLAQKLKKYLFAPCNSADPAELYRQFRGRDPEIGALMRDRGFPEAKE